MIGGVYLGASTLIITMTTLGETMHVGERQLSHYDHSALAPTARIDRITVRSRIGEFVLRLREIDWVDANQDYAALHVGLRSWLIREPMHSLTTRWAPAGFVRIHRSTLVNAARVHDLRPMSKGEFTVVLFNGTELKLSRSYRSAAFALACYEAPAAD